jgi:hemerythrin superfamily protein
MPSARPATATSERSRRGPSTNALTLLRKDHKLVSELFDQFDRKSSRGTEQQKKEIARKVCAELTVHARIEEEIFYPALREAFPEHEDALDEAEVEHQAAKDLIAQIEGNENDELFDAKVCVLGEYVKHHVREEHALFAKIGKSRKIDFEDLGEQLQARKMELMPEAEG